MANKIIVRRGLQANLPVTGLTIGEPFYATDTKKFFIADSTTTMVEYARSSTLGTASTANTGTSAGNVPILDGGGKLSSSILPSTSITDVYVVANQAAQLALTAQEGDVAIRTDLSKTYIHNGGVAGTMADWQEMLTPTDNVLSVNGLTGAVTLTTANVADSTDKRYVTDAEKTKLTNISGTNTGDETTATIKTKLGVAGASTDGYLTTANWNTFNAKLDTNSTIDGGTF